MKEWAQALMWGYCNASLSPPLPRFRCCGSIRAAHSLPFSCPVKILPVHPNLPAHPTCIFSFSCLYLTVNFIVVLLAKGHIFICTNNCTNTQSIATPVPSAAPHRQVLLKPTRAIDAFQRVELEVSWRKLEDAFVPPSQSGHCNSLISFEKQFEGFSVKQKCIGQPFNILDEYARLGVFLPEELVGNKSPTHSLHSPPDGFIESNNTLSTSSSCSSHFQYPYIFQSKWRISVANTSYQACPTYPKYVIVPSAISDSHLALSSKQRSIDRIPVLTWIHPDNGASLCRSVASLLSDRRSNYPCIINHNLHDIFHVETPILFLYAIDQVSRWSGL